MGPYTFEPGLATDRAQVMFRDYFGALRCRSKLRKFYGNTEVILLMVFDQGGEARSLVTI